MQQLHTINQLNSRVNYLEETLNDLLHKEDTALDLDDWKKAINIDLDQSLSGVKTNISEFQSVVSRLQEQVELMGNRLNATNAESMVQAKEAKRKAPNKQASRAMLTNILYKLNTEEHLSGRTVAYATVVSSARVSFETTLALMRMSF